MAPERVGKRVRVYWSEEEEWFEGTIQEFDESQGYYVVYDDGDERWESEGQPMLVEGEEEAQTAANYEELRDTDRTPQMMEPPASPGSDDDDDYEGVEQSENHQKPQAVDDTDADEPPGAHEVQPQNEEIDYSEDESDQDTYQQEKEEDQQSNSQSGNNVENDMEDHRGEDMDDTRDTQSIAESEIPQTFGTTREKTSKRSRQEKARSAKRTAPAQTSSSSINRRRFEQQVAKDNRSFAKRLEWKEARRTRQSAQAKAQEKRKVTPPQHGARKHGHKSHSGINRTKFVQQIAAENKAMGRRLQNILGTDDGARNPEKFSSWAAAEPKDSLSYDYMDRDKLHAQDKRWQRQVELDFLMEKAQTTYQQQHQMVEEVMELQEAVATLKTQVDTLNKSVLRLNILNKKDQHVRDCLLRAAVTSGSSAVKASPRQPHTLNGSSSKTRTQNNPEDSDSSGKNRKEQELELLTQHRDRLQADKRKSSQELMALNQQELELDSEMEDQQSKWEYALATQLFHRQMGKKNAAQTQQAMQEMKRRQKALELSREEEEQWACYQAHQELTQLQIAIQILKDQHGGGLAGSRASKSSSTAVCEYLTKKIAKQERKLQQLQEEVERRRNDYEAMLVSGGNESLRRRVQELQKLVFLCKSQASHVKKAERSARRKGEQVDLEFQRRLFSEQTETDILLKNIPKQEELK
ncbi:hypothetical protein PInf_000023 [Phytophthora infestans]|nr:hypothetical protein PInf_000023 [Phytophthora infestans]